jgi:NAD(P)-dependent dehydrogenase (short-subunit alcohol dehydrogenase family)
MYSLEGRVAIVTGTGRPLGIGRSIALRLAQEGADVVVGDLCRPLEPLPDHPVGMPQGLEALVKEIEGLGRRALAVKVDVTVNGEVEAMVRQAVDEFGKVDILVNNAGATFGEPPTLEMGEEIWDKTFAINMKGTFLCSVAVAKEMIKRGEGGKIVNIASQAGKWGGLNNPRPVDAPPGPSLPRQAMGLAAYSASKAAIISFTRYFAVEMGPFKINVNAVCPGWVETSSITEGLTKAAQTLGLTYEQLRDILVANTIPLGRVETPEDVANLAVFLASGEADFMTGQAINITGGIEMH